MKCELTHHEYLNRFSAQVLGSMHGSWAEVKKLPRLNHERLLGELDAQLPQLDVQDVSVRAPVRVSEAGVEAEPGYQRLLRIDLFPFEGVRALDPGAISERSVDGGHGPDGSFWLGRTQVPLPKRTISSILNIWLEKERHHLRSASSRAIAPPWRL